MDKNICFRDNEEIDIQDSSLTIIDAEAVSLRTKLYRRLDAMTKDEREMLVKVMQFNVMTEMLSAVKNMKNTAQSTWADIIKKMKALTGFHISGGADFNEILKSLIPAVGALAGFLLAVRESETAEIDAAEPEEDENILLNGSVPELDSDKVFSENKAKSIILQYCTEKKNGFSF